MKKLIRLTTVLTVAFLIFSCSSDDDSNEETQQNEQGDNSMLIGSWTKKGMLGGIDGTETITFTADWKYNVELVRTEDFNGPCSLDPYCDNNYSGDYWFSGSALFYDSDYHGWTDSYSNWSVSANTLTLDGENYYK